MKNQNKDLYAQTAPDSGILPLRENIEVALAEIPMPAQTPAIQPTDSFPTERQTVPAAVIRTAACTIELSNTISGTLLAAILREVTHV